MHRSFACAVLLLLLACVTASVLGDCVKPTVSQSRQTSWTDGSGTTYSVWDASITADANTIATVVLSIDASTNNAAIDNLWEMVPQSGLYSLPAWRLQNGGIPQGQTHRFGYTIRSASAANFKVSAWTCPGGVTPNPSAAPSSPANPSASPAAPSPSPAASSQPSPSAVPTAGPVCQSVLVVDNWVRRNLPQMSVQQIADKYANYWSDINLFYQINFGVNLNLSHVYVEDGSSFSETLDGDLLLSQFRNGLGDGIFDVPSGACLYHLITGRNPYGVGGIAYLNSACTGFGAAGFSVDGQGDDEPTSIIGFAIHEIGHNLGGNHPDAYPASAGFTCSINEDRADHRILRQTSTSPYQYLDPTNFISDCATQSIKSSLPSFSCMWPQETLNSVLPRAVFCRDSDAEGECLTVPALSGTSQCYNIMPINDDTSSFQLFAGNTGAVGLQLFADVDCVGSSVVVRQNYSPSLPNFDDTASSFKFIMQ